MSESGRVFVSFLVGWLEPSLFLTDYSNSKGFSVRIIPVLVLSKFSYVDINISMICNFFRWQVFKELIDLFLKPKFLV